jgi:hypothetical protein
MAIKSSNEIINMNQKIKNALIILKPPETNIRSSFFLNIKSVITNRGFRIKYNPMFISTKLIKSGSHPENKYIHRITRNKLKKNKG